jgi:Uma2 family endonuclease
MSTAVAPPHEPMTLEQWGELDEEDRRELVDGFLEDCEVTGALHETIVPILIGSLRAWGAGRGLVILGSNAKFAVAPRRGRMPDFSVYLPGDPPPQRKGILQSQPSIMCEVVTPTPRDQRRDRVEKLVDYAKFGVRWYWIVDPELRTFEILERDAEGRYVHVVGVSEGTVEYVPGCQGLVIDVSAMWSEIDALPPATDE